MAGLEAVPSGSTKSVRDASLLNRDQKISAYGELVRQMRLKGCPSDKIDEVLNTLEDQVGELQDMFSGLVPGNPTVREWLVKVIDRQVQVKNKEDLENFRVDIGHGELQSLINPTNDSDRFPVTNAAFLRLFGKKSVSLAGLIKTMRTEVLPFASTVSSNNPLQEVLNLFAASRFITIGKNEIASGIRMAFRNLAEKKIWEKFPPSNDGSEVVNAKRAAMLGNIDRYFKDNADIINKLILNKNEDGEKKDGAQKADSFDYFEGSRDSELFNLFNRAIFSSGGIDKYGKSTGKIVDNNLILYIGGLACLHELVSYLEGYGGNKNDIYGISEKGDKYASKALVLAATDLALSAKGWPDITTVGPDRLTLPEYIELLKTDPAMFFGNGKLDGLNLAQYQPVEISIPSQF